MVKNEDSKRKYLSADETATFCGQIYLTLQAGIPVFEGIENIAEGCEDKEGRELLKNMTETVVKTGSLYKAVKEAGCFRSYMVNMIHIGEETGNLDKVLISLQQYYERDSKISKAIKSAVTYPILLMVMMAAVVTLLVTRVMPVFEEIFNNLGSGMSQTGKTVMNAGMIIGYVVFIMTAVIVILAVVGVILTKTGHGGAITRVFFSIPGLKKVTKKISAGRFASAISMMLSSGYSMEKSLELVKDIIDDRQVEEEIKKCSQMVSEGKKFSEALSAIKLYSPMEIRMISAGEKAGALDSVMADMAKKYEEQVADSIDNAVSVIEPTIVAVLSLVIGGILISVMLPLSSIMSSIG